jgi:thiol-disulfide isomerase/thioredoxin
MKKYLPFIIFVTVFAAVLAAQVGYKMFYVSSPDLKYSSEYQEYEKSFLHANYKDIAGKSVEMTKLNSPVVIYNFWASWCIPCLSEMPSMLSMKKRFKADQVQIIAINTDEDNQIENIKKTMQKIGMKNEFTIIPDKSAKLINEFKISSIPVTIIFHRGKVVEFSNGPMDFNSEEFLEKMRGWITN